MSRCGRVPRRCAPPPHHDHVAPADVVAARHNALRGARKHGGLRDEDGVGFDAIVEHVLVAVDGMTRGPSKPPWRRKLTCQSVPSATASAAARRRATSRPAPTPSRRFERGDVQVERVLLLREDRAGEERLRDLSHHP